MAGKIIQTSLEQYEKQRGALEDAIRSLDADYASKRETAIATLNQVIGAILALQSLLASEQQAAQQELPELPAETVDRE